MEVRIALRILPVSPGQAAAAAIPVTGGLIAADNKDGTLTNTGVLKLAPGSYDLEVTSANCSWTASVWDNR